MSFLDFALLFFLFLLIFSRLRPRDLVRFVTLKFMNITIWVQHDQQYLSRHIRNHYPKCLHGLLNAPMHECIQTRHKKKYYRAISRVFPHRDDLPDPHQALCLYVTSTTWQVLVDLAP